MGDDTAKFVSDFGAMVRLAQSTQPTSDRGRELVDTMAAHLGAQPSSLPLVVEEVPVHRLVDADIVLASLVG
ncbi:hypothetical protein [uncultured Arthrobacter sp.]|uniref:hypothetical protein n=1 Tax=uncultured Arthrobacter sp. TaxID=114050 RepID=UPI002633F8D1|nr:hypothetical protein [uncultured Arthrobacter sp.]